MERIEDFAALSPLLTAQLKPGVYTNHLMAPGDYDREIAAGLTVFPFPGGLWLRRSRAGHGLYTFYWQRGAELCPPPAAEAAVTEIVWRPGKEARALEAVARLEACPTVTQIYRVTGSHKLHVHAVAADAEEMERLIREVIDPLPGVTRCSCSTILSRVKDIKGLRL